MRKIERLDLSPATLRFLERQARTVKGSKDPATEAARLWNRRSSKTARAAFDEVRRTLEQMASGLERCMYCEDSHGPNIEHFRPKSRFPLDSFDWNNLLLACEGCNSNHKRTQFPTRNGKALLINPVEDEPRDHLALSPSTGKFQGRTGKGRESIRVFGLDRRTLEQGRTNAWFAAQALIVLFAKAARARRSAAALAYQRALCQRPFASVLVWLLGAARKGASDLIDPDCLAAISAYPEILGWV